MCPLLWTHESVVADTPQVWCEPHSPVGVMKETVYWPFWVWIVFTLVFTEEDTDEDGGLKVEGVGVSDRSFFLSLSTCFISRTAILSPLPPRDRFFLSRTAWASLRLLNTNTHKLMPEVHFIQGLHNRKETETEMIKSDVSGKYGTLTIAKTRTGQ